MFADALLVRSGRTYERTVRGEKGLRELESLMPRLEAMPPITIASDFDGPAANRKAYATRFSGKYSHQILRGIGHTVPQEAPEAFAKAVVDVAGYSS